jgi:hypothetical protein
MTTKPAPAPRKPARAPKKPKAMVPLVVRIPASLLVNLRRRAKAEGVDLSTVVRNALTGAYLQTERAASE